MVALCVPALAITGLAGSGPAGHENGLLGGHVALGWLFLGFCAWHTYLNRRALVRYARSAAARLSVVSREAAAALGLVGVVVGIIVGHALVHTG